MTRFVTIKRSIFNKITKRLTDKQYFQLLFFLKFRRLPQLDPPRTLNEKTNWRILFDRREIFTRLSDKAGMRDYVKGIGLSKYLPNTYFIGNNPSEIDFDQLPASFVVKPNHLSGRLIAVNDKQSLDKQKLLKICDEWLSFSYYDMGREWPYKNIKAQIIVEELLGEVERLKVYKFHCFRGVPKLLAILQGYTSQLVKIASYDMDWNKQVLERAPEEDTDFLKPSRFEEMKALASKLSEPFDYVRVDLYHLEERIVISELTVTPSSGLNIHTGYLDLLLGNYWERKDWKPSNAK